MSEPRLSRHFKQINSVIPAGQKLKQWMNTDPKTRGCVIEMAALYLQGYYFI
jgi:hypothetical protein